MKLFRIRPKQEDCTILDLPHNRLEQLGDIIRQRYDVILFCGLWTLLFAIPLVVALTLHVVLLSSIVSSFSTGKISSADYSSQGISLSFLFSFIEALCIFLLAVPVAGMVRVYRLLSFGEGVFFKDDFFKGIKNNIRPSLGLFGILAFSFFVSFSSSSYISFSGINGFGPTIIFFLPLFIVFFVYFIPFLFSLCELGIYDNPFFGNLRNGFSFYVHSFYKSLPLGALLVSPFLLFLIGNIYVYVGVTMLYFLILFPLGFLAFFVFSVSEFDKTINIKEHPDIVNKGIYPLTDDMERELYERKKTNAENKRLKRKQRIKKHGKND